MNCLARRNAGVHPRLLAAMAVLAVIAVPAGWVVGQLIPRTDYFLRRRGALISVQVTPDRPRPGAFRSETVRLTADTGLIVDLRVLRPAGQTRPLPLVVLLGGHRTGRNAVEVVGDPGELVVAALDYPYHGPEKVRGWRQGIAAVPLIRRGLLDTPPAIFLAVDWLQGQPWVDRRRIELAGVSLGAPFAATAGALDHRFRRVWIVHGAADNRAWLEYSLRSRIANAGARSGAATLLHLLAYGPSFDAGAWAARIAPRSVVVIGAKSDERLPRSMVERLYALTGEPKELLWTEGGHINPDHPETVRQLLEILRSRVGQ